MSVNVSLPTGSVGSSSGGKVTCFTKVVFGAPYNRTYDSKVITESTPSLIELSGKGVIKEIIPIWSGSGIPLTGTVSIIIDGKEFINKTIKYCAIGDSANIGNKIIATQDFEVRNTGTRGYNQFFWLDANGNLKWCAIQATSWVCFPTSNNFINSETCAVQCTENQLTFENSFALKMTQNYESSGANSGALISYELYE